MLCSLPKIWQWHKVVYDEPAVYFVCVCVLSAFNARQPTNNQYIWICWYMKKAKINRELQ